MNIDWWHKFRHPQVSYSVPSPDSVLSVVIALAAGPPDRQSGKRLWGERVDGRLDHACHEAQIGERGCAL